MQLAAGLHKYYGKFLGRLHNENILCSYFTRNRFLNYYKRGLKMAKVSLKKLSKMMRDLDLCMMSTFTSGGMIASRPMSNNKDVEYDGYSYFFTDGKTKLVSDLKKNKHVNLSFVGDGKLFVSVSGAVNLITNKTKMNDHWVPDLDKWFKDGIDTPGLTMIEVKAKHIKFWQKEKEGEVTLRK